MRVFVAKYGRATLMDFGADINSKKAAQDITTDRSMADFC